jgi:hypothetical protein
VILQRADLRFVRRDDADFASEFLGDKVYLVLVGAFADGGREVLRLEKDLDQI